MRNASGTAKFRSAQAQALPHARGSAAILHLYRCGGALKVDTAQRAVCSYQASAPYKFSSLHFLYVCPRLFAARSACLTRVFAALHAQAAADPANNSERRPPWLCVTAKAQMCRGVVLANAAAQRALGRESSKRASTSLKSRCNQLNI